MARVLEVDGLVKHFPLRDSRLVVQAVTGVSFHIEEGETLGLVGESGSGKTTVGRCILRLIEPTAGGILFEGQDITHITPRALRWLRPRMQMIFQDPYDALNPRMPTGRIIEEPLRLWSDLDAGQRRDRVWELADSVGISRDLLEVYPHQLSGGQQQRVGIARAIATSPSLLVLDEPTSALDPYAHAEIIELLVGLQQRLHLTYLFISHDLHAVRYVSDRIAIMYLSAIVEVGPRDAIFHHPQHPYSRSLLSSVLYPDPAVRRPRKYVLKGEIPSPVALPRGCLLYSRCPTATAECTDERPKLNELENGHEVACSRLTEMDGLGAFEYLGIGKQAVKREA
jgi:oligopeptide/dipeptide ABC transporter ATP-binding protein